MVVAIARTDEYAFRGDDVRYLARRRRSLRSIR